MKARKRNLGSPYNHVLLVLKNQESENRKIIFERVLNCVWFLYYSCLSILLR